VVDHPNIGTPNRAIYGVPSFWGDDDYITVQRRSDTNGFAYRIPINSDWAGDPNNAQRLNDYAVALPIMHRTTGSGDGGGDSSGGGCFVKSLLWNHR
jgi:hypothetical protein